MAESIVLRPIQLSEAVRVHIIEHGKICKDCVRRLVDGLGIEEQALTDADIELAYLNSKGRC